MPLVQKLALALAGGALAAGAAVTPAYAGPAPHAWSRNWEGPFKTRGACKARGNWIVGWPPWEHPGIPGIDKFACVKRAGNVMLDVRWYGQYAT